MRFSPGRAIALLALAALPACERCQPEILPPTIRVEGRLAGRDGTGAPVPAVVLAVRHDPAQTDPPPARLEYRPGGGVQKLERIELEAVESTGLPFSEEFFFVSLSRFAPAPGSDIPVPREISQEPGWVRAHTGDLAVLPLRKDDISLPSLSFDNYAASQLRPAGGAWLARVEDDDSTLAWSIPAGAPNCNAVPLATSLTAPPAGQAVDCFDLQTLTSMFLTTIAVGVVEGIATADLPADVSATQHRMYLVPHILADDRAGFGFIYSVDLQVSVIGVGIAAATAFVPISIHFDRFGGLVVDPLSGMVNPTNPARITVRYEGLLGEPVAQAIRTAVVESVAETELPPVPIGTVTPPGGAPVPLNIPIETALLTLINATTPVPGAGNTPAGVDFNVIALPEQRATVTGPITNEVLRIPIITRTVTAPAGALTAGVTANAAGLVTRTTIRGTAPATAATVITIPAPQVLNPFTLRFLN